MRSLLIGIVCAGLASNSFAADSGDLIKSADPGKLAEVAEIRALEARINMIGARGAVQVSQVADSAQVDFSQMLIKQNDEIIRLLRKIAKEK